MTGFLAVLAVCLPLGLVPSAAAFSAGLMLAGAGRSRAVLWPLLLLGTLLADTLATLAGESALLLWPLLAAALCSLSLFSLPRAALLAAAAFILIRAQAPPEIYVPVFAGCLTGGILLFTTEKKYGIIQENDITSNRNKIERKTAPWQEKPTTTKA